jgi:sigma-B regulation protein RsbU (phosphoserine phosphatase)
LYGVRGVVDVSSRRLIRRLSGRPMLLRADDSIAGRHRRIGFPTRISEFIESGWVVSGDRLVLYTDGLADAVNPQLQLFGMHRLSALAQSLAEQSADEICVGVFEGVAAYQGAAEQFDDMTLLVVEVK